jgi:uridine monophosphate synthetase
MMMKKMSEENSLIAKALFHSGSLKFGTFKLKSGLVSPYYIDLTWLLSAPEDFECVVKSISKEIKKIASSKQIDKLASIALKGALLIPNVANKLRLPCIIIRKAVKRYGVTDRIVGGKVEKLENILFFDDLISDGRSKIEGIKLIEERGGKIETVLVVVDREQGGGKTLDELGYKLKSIIKISDIVKSLLKSKQITKEKAEKITQFVKAHCSN